MEMIMNFLCPYIFIGPEGVLVEGVRRVCKWNDECIELISGDRIITIEGCKLKMQYKSMDSLLVNGTVKQIGFQRGRR